VPRYRRTAYAFLYSQDTALLDVAALLRGTVASESVPEVIGLSALTGSPEPLSAAELELYLALPVREWSEVEDDASASGLAAKGMLVSDADDDELRELRRRDETLAGDQWHVLAALHHFLTRWQGQDVWQELGVDERAAAERAIAGWGPPPPAFHSTGGDVTVLPATSRGGSLYETLRRRRTTRSFDPNGEVSLDELSALLFHVFGAESYAEVEGELAILHKTSPSGGGLHPTEAYPLIRRVAGVEPGVYHYDVQRHALELVAGLPDEEVGELALTIAAGQPFARDAHVTVVLASRFARNFWKYRKHERAYAVLLMDAAHLSQTFYLVAAELGLGAFVTAAINGADAEERLGLDGFSEGTLALLGCGRPGARTELDPEFLPVSELRLE
jgi:putative peptide maturation dehydrogenase